MASELSCWQAWLHDGNISPPVLVSSTRVTLIRLGFIILLCQFSQSGFRLVFFLGHPYATWEDKRNSLWWKPRVMRAYNPTLQMRVSIQSGRVLLFFFFFLINGLTQKAVLTNVKRLSTLYHILIVLKYIITQVSENPL